MFNRKIYPMLNKITPILLMGYGAALSSVLSKAELPWKTIDVAIEIQHRLPNQYFQQQMANVLNRHLNNLSIPWNEHLPLPAPQKEKVSIIVLVWNNLNITIQCLLSIMQYTAHPFELIIIDNGSTKEVRAWVSRKLGRYEHVLYHRNETNQGFPQGCNDGINLATGDHILLLNNDTIVTPFWISRLIATFSDEKVGMVGPMSVRNGSEQNIGIIPYKNTKEMITFSNHYARNNLGAVDEIGVIIGLCMLIRKEVWQQLGGLDPIYGFGNGEDSDYCIRCHRLGYSIVIVQDIFIDHVGSVTFSKIGLPYDRLLKQNYCYSVIKHLPDSMHESVISESVSKDCYSVSVQDWKDVRPWDSTWDHIPLTIKECLLKQENHTPFFPKNKTLVAFPDMNEDWIDTVKKATQHDWKIILRIEPPVTEFRQPIEEDLQRHFTVEQQAAIHIDCQVLPTTRRGEIYAHASGVLQLPRYDHFRFDREIQALGIPVYQF